ncbi:hypothetical protein K502DRAFT_82428 [Neoconidiobolus thromboides FSU 785]|nr:hypothetical protein K502DRAFT_82428 [Neoconidiobolus thromboides FSU 785]
MALRYPRLLILQFRIRMFQFDFTSPKIIIVIFRTIWLKLYITISKLITNYVFILMAYKSIQSKFL